jgi:hypothetical protein
MHKYPTPEPKSKEFRNFTDDSETRNDTEDTEDTDDPEDREDLEDTEGVPLKTHGVLPTLNTKLPLRKFVAEAADISTREASLKTDSNEWKSTTWEFVRLLKTHPRLMCLTADEALEEIPWSVTDFGEDEQLTFLAEWTRVRILPGVPPLKWAVTLADQHPLEPKRKFKAYNKFISLAGWLQVVVGPDVPIFLPVRSVGDIIGKSHTTVATMCRLAVSDGLLSLVRRATPMHATRYRFALERFEVLRDWKGL